MDIKPPLEKEVISSQDLKIRPAFSFYSQSKNLQKHMDVIRGLLGGLFPQPLPFSDKETFEKWIEASVPWISCGAIESPPDCFSMFFLVKPIRSMSTEIYISEMIKRWLLPHEETTILAFEHMLILFESLSRKVFFVGEAKVLIQNKRQADLMRENLKLLKQEFKSAFISGRYAQTLLELGLCL